jgi:hypothetical protein
VFTARYRLGLKMKQSALRLVKVKEERASAINFGIIWLV